MLFNHKTLTNNVFRYKIRTNKQTWNLDIRPTQMKMWVSIFAPPPSGTYIDIKIS